jgi:hypothetical protein
MLPPVVQVRAVCESFFLWIAGAPAVSTRRDPKPEDGTIANDNARKRRSVNRLPKAEVRLPKGMPVQLVEVEVLAELLESLPPIANDNSEDSGE